MSQRGEGVQYIPNTFSSYISLRSELSFKPFKAGLPASSGEKIDIIAEKSGKISKIQIPLTRKILLAQRNVLYRRVRLVEYYQNQLSKVPIIFLE